MQAAADGIAVFRTARRGEPPPDACLMRLDVSTREAAHGQVLLADRIEQLEFSISHFFSEDDGIFARIARIEDRLAGVEQEQSLRPLTDRLDRMAEVLATLSTRMVQPGPAAEALAGDLDTLPGVGPGLVRMLQKAGLHRVEELACADPSRLREALGPVGDVLDTGFLVTRARAAMDEVAEADPFDAEDMREAG